MDRGLVLGSPQDKEGGNGMAGFAGWGAPLAAGIKGEEITAWIKSRWGSSREAELS